MNPTTRKHPRTLQEAFGPYTSRSISEPHTPMDTADKIVAAAALAALAAVAVMALVGWL